MHLLLTKCVDAVYAVSWVPGSTPGCGASHQPEHSGLGVCWAGQEGNGSVLCWKEGLPN